MTFDFDLRMSFHCDFVTDIKIQSSPSPEVNIVARGGRMNSSMIGDKLGNFSDLEKVPAPQFPCTENEWVGQAGSSSSLFQFDDDATQIKLKRQGWKIILGRVLISCSLIS